MDNRRNPRPGGRTRAVETSERVYRILLRAYPRDLRDEYGDEMARCFRDLCRGALADGDGMGLAVLWVRTVPEVLCTALKERSAMMVARNAYRAAVGLTLVTALLLAWVNLAVGVIGSEGNPANLAFFGIIAAGLLGALAARFRPKGMARILFAVALAQALVPLVALVMFRPALTAGVLGVLGGNAFFVALWAGSGLLFRHAAHGLAPAGASPKD